MTEQIPPLEDPRAVNYGPAIPGAGLLTPEQQALIAQDLIIERNAKPPQPAYTEGGWRLNAIYEHPRTGELMAHVQKPDNVNRGGAKMVASKHIPLSGLESLNPSQPSYLDENTITGNKKAKVLEVDGIPDKGDQKVVGEPAVEAVVQVVPVDEKKDQAKRPEEFVQPDLNDVFSSSSRFNEVIHDPLVQPEFKMQLRRLQQTWMEVRLTLMANAVWNDTLKGQLGSVTEVMPEIGRNVTHATDIVEEMQQGLHQFAQAIEYRDRDMMHILAGRYRFFGEAVETLLRDVRMISSDDRLGRVRRGLDTETWSADERIQKITRGVYADMSDEDTEAMVTDMSALAAQGLSLQAISDQLMERVPARTPAWRSRRELIETVSTFARMTDNQMELNLNRFRNEWEALTDNMRRGNYDAAHIHHINRQFLEQVKEQLGVIRRLANATTSYAREAR